MASVAETTHPLSADELTMAKLLILADVQRGRLKEALERATLVAKEEDPLLQELRSVLEVRLDQLEGPEESEGESGEGSESDESEGWISGTDQVGNEEGDGGGEADSDDDDADDEGDDDDDEEEEEEKSDQGFHEKSSSFSSSSSSSSSSSRSSQDLF